MIDVVWQSYNPERSARLFGDQYFFETIFKKKIGQAFALNSFREFIGFDSYKHKSINKNNGAIVMFPLADNENHIEQLNEDLLSLKWVILVLTQNEYGSKAYKGIRHPNMKVWLQSPHLSDTADKFLGLGYPTYIPDEKIEIPESRVYDWFFAGQVNHNRRVQCVNQLKRIPHGNLLATEGFNQGYNYQEYISHMVNSKVVPCPAGPETPDSFRLYEALEVGCIPIVDKHYGRGKNEGDYWKMIFGGYPFQTIDDWSELPSKMEYELKNWDWRSKEISEWWGYYKENLVYDLQESIVDLGGKA